MGWQKERDLDIVQAAKVLKLELRTRFPETKFHVTTDRGSLISEAITVRWTDGAATAKVEPFLVNFEHVDRDPSTGEILLGGNRHVSSARKISDEIRKKEEQWYLETYGEQYNPNDNRQYLSVWHKITQTDYPDGSGKTET